MATLGNLNLGLDSSSSVLPNRDMIDEVIVGHIISQVGFYFIPREAQCLEIWNLIASLKYAKPLPN